MMSIYHEGAVKKECCPVIFLERCILPAQTRKLSQAAFFMPYFQQNSLFIASPDFNLFLFAEADF